MMNATGKDSHHYNPRELALLVAETKDNPKFPNWVSAGLLAQLDDIAE